MEKKSFVFYISWNEAIKEMNEQQVRNFINNLCNYAESKDVVLNDLTERILWSQTQPLLDYNEGKRQKRIENGRKGGLSKGTPTNQNQVDLTPLNSTNQTEDNSTPLTEEGRGLKEEGRGLKEEGRGLKEEGSMLSIKQQEFDILHNKKLSVGWNSLSTQEAARYYDLVEQLKIK
ncbi:hypothetical protein UFOVP187_28 [uncultured Caudovirales phage]|uniref:DUF6291 domain-containing protein n=1 Tax=uncultured Caudovirales phage TaxID=2100421 RepID=A0A6J7WK64_9CAUD|nr:hypothetical protein UFOVP187_28 [uncultured Caudovirales phage]